MADRANAPAAPLQQRRARGSDGTHPLPPRPDEPDRCACDEALEHRAAIGARAALPSLGLLALCFYLPFVRVCNEVPSAAGFSWVSITGERGGTAAWLAPRFLVAALLFALTLTALLRGVAPGRRSLMAAAVGVLACLGGVVVDWCFLLASHGPWRGAEWLWFASLTVATGLGLSLGVRAWRAHGWQRYMGLVSAYGALAATMGVWVVLSALDPPSTERVANVGVGGWLFLGAIACLATVCTAALTRSDALTRRSARR